MEEHTSRLQRRINLIEKLINNEISELTLLLYNSEFKRLNKKFNGIIKFEAIYEEASYKDSVKPYNVKKIN